MLNLPDIRAQFPALTQRIDEQFPVFFDGPGGAQVSTSVLQAMTNYLGRYNANLGAPYFSSEKTMQVMADARQAFADLLNAPSRDNIVFGATATSLMFAFSRSISRDWQAGDEIIVTALDHYSNVSSWVQAAKDKGVMVHQIPVDSTTFEIDYTALENVVSSKTKLIAVTYASNTTGSVVDVQRVVAAAKSVGAMSFIDAVHYAPHYLIDVQSLGCDFLVVSAYKFTGPHLAAIYAKPEHLDRLTPYKVEPAPNLSPNCWEQGTQNFEAMAGVVACIDYLAALSHKDPRSSTRRERLTEAFYAIEAHEMQLSELFLGSLASLPNVTLYGKSTAIGRTPTFAFRLADKSSREVAEFFGKQHICVGDGHFYAQGLCEQFGIMNTGGVIRVGCLHYNTAAEIKLFFDVLMKQLSE